MWLRWSEPKDEPRPGGLEDSDPFWAWLLMQELIGQMAVLELDLEGKTDAAAEQWQHRDPGADWWRRQADLSVRPLG